MLLGGHARGDESLMPARFVDDGEAPEACAGQFAGAVDHDLQHAVELEALVDVEAGLAQPQHPLAQRTQRCLPEAGVGRVSGVCQVPASVCVSAVRPTDDTSVP